MRRAGGISMISCIVRDRYSMSLYYTCTATVRSVVVVYLYMYKNVG